MVGKNVPLMWCHWRLNSSRPINDLLFYFTWKVLSLVPRVAGLEGFHCILLGDLHCTLIRGIGRGLYSSSLLWYALLLLGKGNYFPKSITILPNYKYNDHPSRIGIKLINEEFNKRLGYQRVSSVVFSSTFNFPTLLYINFNLPPYLLHCWCSS